ncbi:MAG: sulfate reduction electron transfer complex DsrMKJOP subunit DsrM [bacterium]
MSVFVAFVAFLVVLGLGYVGGKVTGLHMLFGMVIPYAAFFIFLVGVILRIYKWARSPVPFRIPTTSGQQKSLDWIKSNKFDNPSSTWGVIGRMLAEVLLFRSLFRNTKAEVHDGPHVAYGSSKWLWIGAMAFHWCFLIIYLRHFRFFLEPVPLFASYMADVDGWLTIGIPAIYLTNILIVLALSYLLVRRLLNPQVRIISLPADYFPLLLILGIVLSGMAMRYLEWFRVDLIKVKELALGLVAFSPTVPKGIGTPFYVHLFLISVLLVYFPFSKLMHAGGVFLSPTRNLANNNRFVRHVNPWNPAVEVHEYDHWEHEYKDKIVACGLPLDKPADEEA